QRRPGLFPRRPQQPDRPAYSGSATDRCAPRAHQRRAIASERRDRDLSRLWWRANPQHHAIAAVGRPCGCAISATAKRSRMAADLNEDQLLIVETAREFSREKLRPNAARWEEEGLNRGVLQELAGLGFGGIYVREDVGGSGLSRLDATLIFEELSRGCV